MQAHLTRKASLVKLKSMAIRHRKQQIADCHTFMETQPHRMAGLEEELEKARESCHAVNVTPEGVVYSDLSRNRGVHPRG
jgi:hypothetical protein